LKNFIAFLRDRNIAAKNDLESHERKCNELYSAANDENMSVLQINSLLKEAMIDLSNKLDLLVGGEHKESMKNSLTILSRGICKK